MARAPRGLAVELGERREPLGQPADDRERHRQAELPARTADSGVPPTAIHTGSGSCTGRG